LAPAKNRGYQRESAESPSLKGGGVSTRVGAKLGLSSVQKGLRSKKVEKWGAEGGNLNEERQLSAGEAKLGN